MNDRKLYKIKRDLDSIRNRGGAKPSAIESLAIKLGRRKDTKRGKEPTWISEVFTDLPPLSIPHHGKVDLNKYTAGAIADQLENDVEKWEEKLESDKK